jgi:ectoine hydroxylase-related dioxygenase (phytanoyl-CoA dioxygenase family)
MTHADELRERGYIVARGFFSRPEMEALCEELRTARPRLAGADWLTTGNMIFRSNLYFHSRRLQAFISQPRLVDFLTPIIGPDFWVRWDQAVNKLPGGVEFPWHQDNAYNRLLVPHYQLWVAATPIRRENGGLWLDPGSHARGRLPHRFVGSHAVYRGVPENPLVVEAEAGDVILFSSLLLHCTSPNISTGERWAYVVEYVPCDDFDPYISSPYFMVARHGRPQPRFVRTFRGRLRPRNQLKYFLPRLIVTATRGWSAAQRVLHRA